MGTVLRRQFLKGERRGLRGERGVGSGFGSGGGNFGISSSSSQSVTSSSIAGTLVRLIRAGRGFFEVDVVRD